jgi:predicted DNA-binding transcriptional regulator AlpA
MVYDLAARGLFPKQIRITQGTVAWVESEVAAWVAERVRKRDVPPIAPASKTKKAQRHR